MKRNLDHDGLLLCKIQARVFEKSLQYLDCSSEIFIRRFMNSYIATRFDSAGFLNESTQDVDVLEELNEEYGQSSYGTNKYSGEHLYWIGYIYRYFSYTYNLCSKQVYKIIKPPELNELFYAYHSLDCDKAIERILEVKNISFEKQNIEANRINLFKNIRNKYQKGENIGTIK